MGLSLAAGGGGGSDDDDDAAAGDDIANDADAGPTVAVDVVVEISGVDVILASFLAFNSSFHVYNAYKLSSSL